MAKEITIKGDTVEKKFKNIQMILRRFSRRLHKTVIGAIPPVPLFFHTDIVPEDGVIARWMSPCKGVITNVCLYVGEFNIEDGNPAVFVVGSASPGGNTTSTKISTKRHLNVEATNVSVEPGSRVTFIIDESDHVKDVWVALTFEIGIKGTKKEVFLIDSFNEIISGEIAEDNDAQQV